MQLLRTTNHSLMPALLLGLATLATLGLAAPPAQAQTTLYTQAPVTNGILWASQNDTNAGGNGNFATAYDNFTLGSTAAVTSINWQGGYYNGGSAPISSFALTFYADNAGQPGAAVATETVSGNANQTFVGSSGGLTYENYSAAFAPSFTATAGTKYWLSIVPNLGFPPQWGWNSGTGGDGAAFQEFFGAPSAVANDLAFGLKGTPAAAAPEPSEYAGLGFAAFGLLALGLNVRRKRSAALPAA